MYMLLLTPFLKGKEHKNTYDDGLKVFERLHFLMQTACKSDSYFCIFKMAANGEMLSTKLAYFCIL